MLLQDAGCDIVPAASLPGGVRRHSPWYLFRVCDQGEERFYMKRYSDFKKLDDALRNPRDSLPRLDGGRECLPELPARWIPNGATGTPIREKVRNEFSLHGATVLPSIRALTWLRELSVVILCCDDRITASPHQPIRHALPRYSSHYLCS